MCDIFVYQQGSFASQIMFHFAKLNRKEVSDIVEVMADCISQVELAAVKRRINHYAQGKAWWFYGESESCQLRSKAAKELVYIWKIARQIKQSVYDDEGGPEQYAHNRLAEVEKQLTDGKINENTFIEKCNSIKRLKESEEAIMGACTCSLIGTLNEGKQDTLPDDAEYEWILRIACLPCGWDGNAQIV